jgi:pimeloyl-ACP methyl ester carboxylesterase
MAWGAEAPEGAPAAPAAATLAEERLQAAAQTLVDDAAALGASASDLAGGLRDWVAAYATLEQAERALSAAGWCARRGLDALEARVDALGARVSSAAGEVVDDRIGLRLYVRPEATPTSELGDLGSWDAPLALDAPAIGLERVGLPAHVVLLVHGLDEMGCVWDFAAPMIAGAGYSVARFDYRNDQAIARSAEDLTAALAALHARGVNRVDIIGHSMGGLVAREALTRPGLYGGAGSGRAGLPDVGRLIMIGTPNRGAPLARFQAVTEAREQLLRLIDSDRMSVRELAGFLRDGRGEAADDLLPGSAFLTQLNARPLPEGVEITLISGDAAGLRGSAVERALGSAVLASTLGVDGQAVLRRKVAALADALGDGVVSADAMALAGVTDVVALHGTHRSIVSGSLSAPAIGVILERLGEDAPGGGR